MRIGEFAEVNNLSIDTVRYYVDLNLIRPIRKGKYFYFEGEQQQELDKILYLKSLKFTLEEIKKILLVQDFKNIKTTVESSFYRDMLIEKSEELNTEIAEITKALEEIKAEISRVGKNQQAPDKERGIALANLSLLCCPKCCEAIEITEGTLKGGGIYEGKTQCKCGYSLYLQQGIIVTKHGQENIIDPYEDGYNYIDTFASETPKVFVDFMMNSCKEIARLLIEMNLSDKSVLFMKSGLGILETFLLEQGPKVKQMILIDEDFNKLRVAKKSIESNFPDCNAIYICSELYELPIKKETIDVIVDFLATFVNGFRLDKNMYEYNIPMLKKKSSIIGLYLHFKRFNMLSRLTEGQRKLFDGKTMVQSIRKFGFVETSNFKEIILEDGQNINDFFQDGDIVHTKIMAFSR